MPNEEEIAQRETQLMQREDTHSQKLRTRKRIMQTDFDEFRSGSSQLKQLLQNRERNINRLLAAAYCLIPTIPIALLFFLIYRLTS